MYQHLLVPIDDTELSAANVQSAIDLARALGARVTFFHATPDWGATADGELTRILEPGRFVEAALGATNALLTKAITSAKAMGVRCDGTARTSDRPAAAIVEAAQSLGCDLIVMASRGKDQGFLSGWLYNSQTERVLRRAPVALLVTRVESRRPISDIEHALGIIQDEHRSIAVVVQSMRDMVREVPRSGLVPEIKSLELMVSYLYEFPERVHHPKEEQYLHRLLRERAPAYANMLTELEAQHRIEGALVERTLACLVRAEVGTPGGVQALNDAVHALATHVLHHIGFEERTVLPAARQHLKSSDWAEIAQAFAVNDDPRYGELPTEDLRKLFTRIANNVVEVRRLHMQG